MAENSIITDSNAEENSAVNPSTKAAEKNDVPYGRFQEVNAVKNQLSDENESLKSELAKVKQTQEDARKGAMKKNEEFEVLFNETDSKLKKTEETNKALQGQVDGLRKGLIEKVPEERRYIANNLPMEDLVKFVDEETTSANAGKADQSRPGGKPAGEFGGYESYEEWAVKDPKGYEKANMSNSSQGITLGYGG